MGYRRATERFNNILNPVNVREMKTPGYFGAWR